MLHPHLKMEAAPSHTRGHKQGHKGDRPGCTPGTPAPAAGLLRPASRIGHCTPLRAQPVGREECGRGILLFYIWKRPSRPLPAVALTLGLLGRAGDAQRPLRCSRAGHFGEADQLSPRTSSSLRICARTHALEAPRESQVSPDAKSTTSGWSRVARAAC